MINAYVDPTYADRANSDGTVQPNGSRSGNSLRDQPDRKLGKLEVEKSDGN